MEIAAASASPVPAAAGRQKGLVGSDFETFLKMLTVQMQNQDPLNPIQSSDFAVQLATFSGVEQQVRTNDLLGGLGQQLKLQGMAQMADWIGREARVAAPASFTGTPVELSPNPPVVADRAEVVVYGGTGTEIQRIPVAPDGKPYLWSGKDSLGNPLPNGEYSFKLESFQANKSLGLQPIEIYARVTEARTEGGNTVLVLPGGVRVLASDITGLREPA